MQTAQQLVQDGTAEPAGSSAAGSSLRQFVFVRSVVSAAAILFAAALVCVYGGRVFRRLWVGLHRGYVVFPANGVR